MPSPSPVSRTNERLLLFTLAAVQFTHIMDFMIMMPLGSNLMRVFKIDPERFSHLVASYGLAAAVTGFAGGFVLDRFDRKHALLLLYTGFAVSTLACATAQNYFALLCARIAAGAFGGVSSSVIVAMVGDVIPPNRRGRAMGIVMSAFPIASALGVPFGLLLAGHFEWHAPFFLLVGLSTVVLLTAARTLPNLRSEHPPAHPWTQMTAILSHPIHQRGFLLSGSLVFAGAVIIPFLAPSMVANVGLPESQLWIVYAFGGACTFITTPIVGRLSDKHDKLHVLGWISILGCLVVLILTNLPTASLYVAMAITALFMISMSGRFAPAMAMISNSVENRYRGGFMSVNSAIQQAGSGLANLTAGLLVSQSDSGRLVGYPRVGLVSVACFGLTYFFATRLRAAAPHAARSHPVTVAPVAVD